MFFLCSRENVKLSQACDIPTRVTPTFCTKFWILSCVRAPQNQPHKQHMNRHNVMMRRLVNVLGLFVQAQTPLSVSVLVCDTGE